MLDSPRISIGIDSGRISSKLSRMSLAELKQSVLDLPAEQQHQFVVWVNQVASNYGDIPEEALAQLAAEVWDADDKHAPPTHPAR